MKLQKIQKFQKLKFKHIVCMHKWEYRGVIPIIKDASTNVYYCTKCGRYKEIPILQHKN